MRSEPSSKGKAKDLEPEPEVRVRYVVSVEHLIHPENAQHGAKKCHKCGNKKSFLVLNAGPSSQEEGIEDPTAHPEDARAKVSISSQGLEVTRWPKSAYSMESASFQDHSGDLHGEKKQTTSMEKSADLHGQHRGDLHGQHTRDLHGTSGSTEFLKQSFFLPFPGWSLWPA